MANTNPNFHALGDINPCRFVVLETSDYGVTEADSNEFVAGISQEGSQDSPIPGASSLAATAAKPQLRVHGDGDCCLLEIADTIAVGGLIKSDNDGKGVPVATSGTTAQNIGAEALQAGVSGDKIHVRVFRQRLVYPALA